MLWIKPLPLPISLEKVKDLKMVVMMSDQVVLEKEDVASELVSPVSEAWPLRVYLISLQSTIDGS